VAEGAKGVAETTSNGGLGVVLTTPLGPWGWPSHPLVPYGHKFFFFFFLKKYVVDFFKKN
jgi:hypothetical protein